VNEALVRRVAVALLGVQVPGADPDAPTWTADGRTQRPAWTMYEADARAALAAVEAARTEQATQPTPEVLDALARELWEAHATHHQQVIAFPQEHWDQLDLFSQDHWRVIARTALAFGRPG
jgi:hypothetical protein